MIQELREDLRRLFPDSQEISPADTIRCVARGIASPGFQALLVYRIFHWAQVHHIPTQPLRYGVERLIEITTGISIPAEAALGPGLRIHHFGGIIVHPKVKTGPGCTLYHGVTLGTDGQSEDAPTLGRDVLVGAGAKILGGIHLGDRCRVGANAVVTRSYGPDTVLGGVPARPLSRSATATETETETETETATAPAPEVEGTPGAVPSEQLPCSAPPSALPSPSPEGARA